MSKPDYRFIRWLQGPIGRRLNSVFWRLPAWKSWTSRHVWAEIEKDEDFMEDIRLGQADMEAGRTWRYSVDDLRNGVGGVPSEKWLPDDPIQPKGWHHDGAKWVKDDVPT